MYCLKCGAVLSENEKFCQVCGNVIQISQQCTNSVNENLVGFSSKIQDPAFAKYIKNTNRWSSIFSFILALIAVIGFFIYGEVSSEMDNPKAMFIGLVVGGMFVVIAFIQIIGRNRSKTWDGIVVDKKIEEKNRKRNIGNNDYYWENYVLYSVFVKSNSGKMHTISSENDDTLYNYYVVGDKVKHHAGLNSYEKYDKSRDTIILCNACASLNNINDDYCFRCKCPLLK